MKNRIFFIAWIFMIALIVFLYSQNRSKKYDPVPLESRKDIVWLAKKYEIPLETVLRIKRTKQGNWKQSIESLSKETGIPEKTIASILIEGENTFYKGNYGDS